MKDNKDNTSKKILPPETMEIVQTIRGQAHDRVREILGDEEYMRLIVDAVKHAHDNLTDEEWDKIDKFEEAGNHAENVVEECYEIIKDSFGRIFAICTLQAIEEYRIKAENLTDEQCDILCMLQSDAIKELIESYMII